MPRLLAAIAIALCAVPVAAQQPIDFSKVEIKMTDLGRGLYQMDSAGGNLLVLTGPEECSWSTIPMRSSSTRSRLP